LSFIIDKRNKAPRVNKVYVVNRRGRWLVKRLEEVMKVIERGTCSLRKAVSWNMLLSSLLDHLNGNNVSKTQANRCINKKKGCNNN
jgi:hypothetical protein